jgi:hypothetical protein
MYWTKKLIGLIALCAMLAPALANPGPEPSVSLYWYEAFDPTTGAGVCAPQWQLLIRTDVPTLYAHTGTSCTAWTPIAGGGAGNVSGTGTYNTMTQWTGTDTIGDSLITTDGSGELNMNPAQTPGNGTIVHYMDSNAFGDNTTWRNVDYQDSGSAFFASIFTVASPPHTPAPGYPNPLYDHEGEPLCWNYGRHNTIEPQVCRGGFESGWINGSGEVPATENYDDFVDNTGGDHRWLASVDAWDGSLADTSISGWYIGFLDWTSPGNTVAEFEMSTTPTTVASTLLLGGQTVGYAGTSLIIESNAATPFLVENGNASTGYFQVNNNGIDGIGPFGFTSAGVYEIGGPGGGAGSTTLTIAANNSSDSLNLYVMTNGDVQLLNESNTPNAGVFQFNTQNTGGFDFSTSSQPNAMTIADDGAVAVLAGAAATTPLTISVNGHPVLDLSTAGIIYTAQSYSGVLGEFTTATAGDDTIEVVKSDGQSTILGTYGSYSIVQSLPGVLALIPNTDLLVCPSGFTACTEDFGLTKYTVSNASGVTAAIYSTATPSATNATLSMTSTDAWGDLGAASSSTVTLTLGIVGGFPNNSRCSASVTGGSVGVDVIVTQSKTAPTFTCYTGAALVTCPNLTYTCPGY